MTSQSRRKHQITVLITHKKARRTNRTDRRVAARQLAVWLTLGFAIVFIAGSYLSAHQRPDPEKLSTYECGFAPFEDTRSQFDVADSGTVIPN